MITCFEKLMLLYTKICESIRLIEYFHNFYIFRLEVFLCINILRSIGRIAFLKPVIESLALQCIESVSILIYLLVMYVKIWHELYLLNYYNYISCFKYNNKTK